MDLLDAQFGDYLEPYHHDAEAKKGRLYDFSGERKSRWWFSLETEETGPYISHPIHNQQLHIRCTAGRTVGHQCYVLIASVDAGVQRPISLFETNAVNTCTFRPICHLGKEIPCG